MADSLATPITTTATQYRLDRVELHIDSQTATIVVSLLDAAGADIKRATFGDTWVGMAIPSSMTTALRTVAVAYLKAKGTIN